MSGKQLADSAGQPGKKLPEAEGQEVSAEVLEELREQCKGMFASLGQTKTAVAVLARRPKPRQEEVRFLCPA